MSPLALALLIVLGLAAPPAFAAHTSFSFDVDRVEITDGTSLGAFVDEFDDDELSPWSLFQGTATEANGLLTISGPGVHEEDVWFGFHRDRSDVMLGMSWDGLGGFTVISSWLETVPPFSQVFAHCFVVPLGAGSHSSTCVGVSNGDPDVAEAFGPGTHAGLVGFGYQDFVTSGGIVTSFTMTTVPLVSGDITGDILLRTVFDDDADTFSSSISLDGGANYALSFAALPAGPSGSLWLTVESLTLPEPSVATLVACALAALAVRRAAASRPGST
jgi:hypothetical protein